VLGALGLAEAPADPILAARAAFGRGLFRLGIALLNVAIQDGAELVEAWLLKARFLHSVGFNRTAAVMLESSLAQLAHGSDRIMILEEQSFLWAECECGEEALRSADAAVELGSHSVRTHYLRGRALGMLGRLDEARNELNVVLTLDPRNAEARRGLDLIDAAMPSTTGKRWWQFWK